jgi:tRNA 2-thiouridine synthesizing protein E
MLNNTDGDTVATDEEGYLIDPGLWDETVARRLANEEQLEMGDEHWQVLRFMRDYYDEHQVIADARFTIRFLANDLGYDRKARNRLFALFPYGYVKQACKIAGMKRPRAWSTG